MEKHDQNTVYSSLGGVIHHGDDKKSKNKNKEDISKSFCQNVSIV